MFVYIINNLRKLLRQLSPDILDWSRAWLRISPREAVLLSPQCMAVLFQQDELSRFPGDDDDTIPRRRQDPLKSVIRAIRSGNRIDEEGIVAALINHTILLMVDLHRANQLTHDYPVVRIRYRDLSRWSE